MYYRLKNDVYLVMGQAKHALYDLKHGNLYNISNIAKEAIIKSHQIKNFREESSAQENAIIQSLIELGLLVSSEKFSELIDIRSLAKLTSVDFAWIETTRQCNLACDFCYEGSNPYCHERMSLEDFNILHSQLKEAGIKQIQFIGGEPLILKNDLKTMILQCRNDFNFIEVYTNGVMINAQWCDFFKRNSIHIALSIHSYIPEEHDRVVNQKGAHKRVVRALSLLQKFEIPYRIGTVENNDCKIGKKPKDAIYTLYPKAPKACGQAHVGQFNFAMFQNKAITKATKRYPIDKNFVIQQVSGHQCFSHEIYVAHNLEIYPCVMERRLSYGNLKKSRLKDLLMNKTRTLTKDHIHGCNECEFRYACFDCRPDSNGRGFYDKPWFCTYDPKKGMWHNLKATFDYLQKNQNHRKEIVTIKKIAIKNSHKEINLK